jgi:outer membrane protein OmpA-like peptidoglycan-associated protein
MANENRFFHKVRGIDLLRGFVLLASVILVLSNATAQTSVSTNRELVDLLSFFNGAYPYNAASPTKFSNQLVLIGGGYAKDKYQSFFPEKKGQPVEIFYALQAPATVDSFNIAYADHKSRVPHKIEFAVSQSPTGDFQPVATYDVPSKYYDEKAPTRISYDFNIDANKKISARYLRVTLSGSEWGTVGISRLNAYGRFDQPVEARKDFSGFYHVLGIATNGTLADKAMTGHSKEGLLPYVVLHQEGASITGCYVYGNSSGKLDVVGDVLGSLSGGVEGNLFRFTRTHAADGSVSQGVLALAPNDKGVKVMDQFSARMVVIPVAAGQDQKLVRTTDFSLVRESSAPVPCATTGQKEKTASEVMKDSLEKTGKVQLYGVNFDFDSDRLRPESGAVLDAVVQVAKANPGWKFEVGGHTDSIGTPDYNLKLSDRRAASVVRYLVEKGVAPNRLQAKGYGSTRPLVPEDGDNASARAQNRRVELEKRP